MPDAFDQAVFATEGYEITLKFRELIAPPVGTTAQCVYCVKPHFKKVADAGAIEGKRTEAAYFATAIRAGGDFARNLAFTFRKLHDGCGGTSTSCEFNTTGCVEPCISTKREVGPSTGA